MKTFNEKVQEAHSCKKSEGKIIAISMDKLGNTYCAYCNQRVDYPQPSSKEIKEIIEKTGL